tara:strand:+ start:893 stop:1861 length:969 start_codon:yes stop_codon:yes gene_type:complete
MKKRQNFELPTITTTYAGEASADFIAAALLSAKTLDNNLITIHPNVKYREVIQKLDVSGIVQDASCDFVSAGAVAVSERQLTPKELQVNLDLCKQTFVNSWEALSLGYSAFDEIPRNFTDYLVSYVGGKVAEATETSIWQGNVATNGQFGGFDAAFVASIAAGGATDVLPALANGTGAVVTGAITSANVLERLNDLYSTIPDTVFGKEDLVIYAPTNVTKAYQQALSGVVNVGSFNNNLNVGEKPSNFQGIEIVHAPGMKASTLVAAQKSNLHFGTGLMSDYNEVRVLDMAQLDGSQNFRVIMRYTADTEFGIGQDIVYYAG